MILSLVNIVVNSIILRYVYELEMRKCECSVGGLQKFIKYVGPVVIAMSLFSLFVSQKSLINLKNKNRVIQGALGLIGLLTIVYYICLIVYFSKLTHSNCECSENWKRWSLLYPALVVVVVLLLAFLMVLRLLVTGKRGNIGLTFSMKTQNNNKTKLKK